MEATPDGWWYTAPTPGGSLTVLHVTDPADRRPAIAPPHTTHRLGRNNLTRPDGYRIAPIGHARPAWAPGLVAAGDAALSVDPLSSSGLQHCLDHSAPAATAALGLVHRDTTPAERHSHLIHTAFEHHILQRQRILTAATRYQHHDFWKHRRTAHSVHKGL